MKYELLITMSKWEKNNQENYVKTLEKRSMEDGQTCRRRKRKKGKIFQQMLCYREEHIFNEIRA